MRVPNNPNPRPRGPQGPNNGQGQGNGGQQGNQGQRPPQQGQRPQQSNGGQQRPQGNQGQGQGQPRNPQGTQGQRPPQQGQRPQGNPQGNPGQRPPQQRPQGNQAPRPQQGNPQGQYQQSAESRERARQAREAAQGDPRLQNPQGFHAPEPEPLVQSHFLDRFSTPETGQLDVDGGADVFDEINEEPSPKGKKKSSGKKPKKKRMSTKKKTWLSISLAVAIAGSGTGIYFLQDYVHNHTPVAEAFRGVTTLDTWGQAVKGYDRDAIELMTGSTSFLGQESDYANEDPAKISFITNMLATVSYTPAEVPIINSKGEPILSKEGATTIDTSFLVIPGEEVDLSMVDYAAIDVSKEKIGPLVAAAKLNGNDPDFPAKATDLFIKYMNALALQEGALPLKTGKHIPSLIAVEDSVVDVGGKEKKGTTYSMSADEDIFLDKALFSSPEFKDLQGRFSESITGKSPITKAWVDWDKLRTERTAKQAEIDKAKEAEAAKNVPDGTLGEVQVEGTEGAVVPEGEVKPEEPAVAETKDDTKKDAEKKVDPKVKAAADKKKKEEDAKKAKEDAAKKQAGLLTTVLDPLPPEPAKFDTRLTTQDKWIGAYYLQNELAKNPDGTVDSQAPAVGTGTKESPAGLNSPVTTVQWEKAVGGKKLPIRVSMNWILSGPEAIDWVEKKDIRNRGFYAQSKVTMIAASLYVENLSPNEITIRDNTTLSDGNGNIFGRTGRLYGITDTVKLKPGERGEIQTWTNTTSPETMYLTWGKDFQRQEEPKWFRVMAAEDGTVTYETGGTGVNEKPEGLEIPGEETVVEPPVEEAPVEGSGSEAPVEGGDAVLPPAP